MICFRKTLSVILAFTVLSGGLSLSLAERVRGEDIPDNTPFDVEAQSALLMEYDTGEVLYSKNSCAALPPASVTKIMTLLLVFESIDSGVLSMDKTLTVSEYGASMGGSQVFLEPGEEMTVHDLIKSVAVSSANDAAVTLAEGVCGTETVFVEKMNEKAASLGMTSTHFENCTGLDDTVTNHVTSACDIALMSRALMSHEGVFEFTKIWMDTIRNGAFGLSNTNRLIRFYNGATGLKTGSTAKAKFCISATAERDGMHLIAVIMGSPTRDKRNEAAKTLLDWGFANYSVYRDEGGSGGTVTVKGGELPAVETEYKGQCLLLKKGESSKVEKEVSLPETVDAPVKAGDSVGKVSYKVGDTEVASSDITVLSDCGRITYWGIVKKMLCCMGIM